MSSILICSEGETSLTAPPITIHQAVSYLYLQNPPRQIARPPPPTIPFSFSSLVPLRNVVLSDTDKDLVPPMCFLEMSRIDHPPGCLHSEIVLMNVKKFRSSLPFVKIQLER